MCSLPATEPSSRFLHSYINPFLESAAWTAARWLSSGNLDASWQASSHRNVLYIRICITFSTKYRQLGRFVTPDEHFDIIHIDFMHGLSQDYMCRLFHTAGQHNWERYNACQNSQLCRATFVLSWCIASVYTHHSGAPWTQLCNSVHATPTCHAQNFHLWIIWPFTSKQTLYLNSMCSSQVIIVSIYLHSINCLFHRQIAIIIVPNYPSKQCN